MSTSSPSSRGLRVLLEMVSIVFAVVLGFAVTNWDAARKDRARAAAAVERIRMELEANQASLATAAPYYATMTQRLDSILADRGDGNLRGVSVPGWRGLSPPSLRTASFALATETGALEHIEFELADELAVTYEVLEDLSSSVDHALGAVMGGQLNNLSDWLGVLSLFAEISYGAQAQTERALSRLASSGS